jgi:hypothetical protein
VPLPATVNKGVALVSGVAGAGGPRSPAAECDIVLGGIAGRFSRDQQHVAGLYKQLAFVGVRIFTVNYGESR